MLRQRGELRRSGWDHRDALFCWTIPPAVSAWSVGTAPSRGSSVRPAIRISASMSCGRSS